MVSINLLNAFLKSGFPGSSRSKNIYIYIWLDILSNRKRAKAGTVEMKGIKIQRLVVLKLIILFRIFL